MRARLPRSIAVIASFGLLLAACGGEAADRDALVRAMTEQAQLTEEQANCIADEIFLNSDLTEAEINNGADDLEGASRFRQAYEAALASCAGL